MGESLLLITIITLVVITIRRARPVILERPVIIQRAGEYHITLAPQLNRAQTFVEQIAAQFFKIHEAHGDTQTRYLEIRDPKVFAEGVKYYLLAITLRGGMFYFQVTSPKKGKHEDGSDRQTLHAFADPVLAQHPAAGEADDTAPGKLDEAIKIAAASFNIAYKSIE